MNPTNEYRIIEDMGVYYPQEKYVGLRGGSKWKYMRRVCYSSHGDSFWITEASRDRYEMEKRLAAIIAERGLDAELRERGPVVVREIKA